jgi:hypothetical protein
MKRSIPARKVLRRVPSASISGRGRSAPLRATPALTPRRTIGSPPPPRSPRPPTGCPAAPLRAYAGTVKEPVTGGEKAANEKPLETEHSIPAKTFPPGTEASNLAAQITAVQLWSMQTSASTRTRSPHPPNCRASRSPRCRGAVRQAPGPMTATKRNEHDSSRLIRLVGACVRPAVSVSPAHDTGRVSSRIFVDFAREFSQLVEAPSPATTSPLKH